MKKALVLAANMHRYRDFCQHFNLPLEEHIYVTRFESVCGWHWDMPVIILEEYENNRNYTLGLMNYIGHRFNNIGFISEGERWEHEEVPIQYFDSH